MKIDKDYIFVEKADMNEGLTSGTVSKVAFYFTKHYFFVIPFESVHVWQSSTTDYNNADDFIKDINERVESMSVEEFENTLIDFLPNSKVYKVDSLEKFKVQVGFLIFGGLSIKKHGEQLQAASIQPKSVRAKIKKFYEQE